MAILQMLAGENPGERLTIVGPHAILGRHPDCHIVLDSGSVSRQHAQIHVVGDDYLIEDLHSRNGTFVNGQQIQGRHKLQDGDRVKICELSFAFFHHEPSDKLPVGTGMATLADAATLIDDQESSGRSTIMSKLDVSAGAAGIRLNVNPELKLRAFIEITENLRTTLSVDSVLPKLLDSLFKIFVQADRGFVVLRGPAGQLLVKAVKQRRGDNEDTIRISRTIMNNVLTQRQAILSADAATDARFEMSQSIADFRIRSMMCAPLLNNQGEAMGAIQIDTLDQRSRFQQEDLDVLAGVASQAAFALENAQLHEQAIQQRGIQRDLELAHKVQQGLLPSAPPQLSGYHFFDFYLPANQVGGDFYDYIRLPGDRMAVVLADVSGKGVSAALVMARISSEVRYCLASESNAAQAVNRINTAFCTAGWDDRFVTFVLAILDPAKHEATLVNAGHMPPLLRRGAGKVEQAAEELAGLPLGVDPSQQYEATKVTLEPGDFLTMFTDGISEAMDFDNKLYGIERLAAKVGSPVENVTGLGRQILDDVKQFVNGRAQSDDMCLVCFGRDHG